MAWRLPDAASGEQAKKRKGPEATPATGTTDSVVKEIARLSLSNAQRIRDVEGAVVKTYIMDRDHDFIKAMTDAGEKYAKSVEGNPQHTYGPPFIHVWKAFVGVMSRTDYGSAELNSQAKELLEHHTAIEAYSIEQVTACVKLRRTSATFDKPGAKKQNRVHIVAQPRLEEVVGNHFLAAGAVKKYRRPPAGAAERKVAQAIKSMA